MRGLVVATGCLFIGLTACSGGGSGSSGGAGSAPRTKAEALARLSTEHRGHFESWQKQILKSCDAADAFGIGKSNEEPEGVDATALINKNNGSAVFSDAKNIWMLTGYNSLIGLRESKAEEATGDYFIKAEAKREGSYCSVYLFGLKVYETVMAQNFIVGAHYSQEKEMRVAASAPSIVNLGSSDVVEVTKHGLFSLMDQVFTPSKESLVNLGKRLGFSAHETERVLVSGRSTVDESAVRIEGDSVTVWSNYQSSGLIGQSASVKSYFDGLSRELPVEVRLPIPQFNFVGVKNATDNGNLKLSMLIGIEKNNAGFNYTLNKLQNEGVVAFNSDEAQECLNNRVRTFAVVPLKEAINPSLNATLDICKTLYRDVEAVAYKSGLFKSLMPVVFNNVFPSTRFQYEGWQNVLLQLTLDTLAAGKDIVVELDPNQQTAVVLLVARHVVALKSEIETFKNLQSMRDRVYEMGVLWSLKGLNVADGRIHQIAESLNNTVDVFQYSSEMLMKKLADNPNGLDDQLSFATNISREYKEEALQALSLSKELNYSHFEREIFNLTIQSMVSFEDIKQWKTYLSSIRAEMNRYKNLASVRAELVDLSVKWLKEDKVTLEQMRTLYSALNNSAQPFEESTKQLVRDLQKSLTENQVSLDFASGLSAEYKQLAVAIVQGSRAAEYESWGLDFFNSVLQKRPSLEQLKQWNDMWGSIVSFVKREKERIGNDLGSMPEWNRKKLIEMAIKESWSSRDFATAEALALVAKFKNTCDRYKDISSLADCAGMSLFSKQTKKFLDPNYNWRYSMLSVDFNNYLTRLADFQWTNLRWTLVDEFFGSRQPIWAKCDDSAFTQKAQSLKSQVQEILATTDQFKKWELERQIKETIQNCK